MHPWNRLPFALSSVLAFGLYASACENFVEDRVYAGIGASCQEDEDCQASECFRKPGQSEDEPGICTVGCKGADDCPSPTVCTGAGVCEVPLKAGFIYSGPSDQEQWAFSHELGRQYAQNRLSYLTTEVLENRPEADDVTAAIDELVAGGSQLIFVNSPTHASTVVDKASQHRSVLFYVAGSRVSSGNVFSYYGRMYQAYYLAGIAAGERSEAGRIGIVASFPTPAVVAQVNAFHLGAETKNADVVTEVKWIGFWHGEPDPETGFSEELIATQELLAGGADVIAHTMDNGTVPATVRTQGTTLDLSIGANVPTACDGIDRCLGTTYWNWGPLYAGIINAAHTEFPNTGALGRISVDPDTSLVNFILSPEIDGAQNLTLEIDAQRENLAGDDGVGRVFQGPISSTGQCGAAPDFECIPVDERLDQQGLDSMCWHVSGIVELMDMGPMDPPVDVPALVPEEGDCIPVPEME